MRVIKIILDIVMVGLFIALLFSLKTGFVFHEIIGLFTFLLFMLHIVLNGKQVIGVIKGLFSKELKEKTTWMYLLNVCLLIGVTTIVVTGLLTSKLVLPASEYHETLSILHKWAAFCVAGMIAIHLCLHLKYLAATFKKIVSELKTPTVWKALSSTVAAVLILAFAFSNVILGIQKSIRANAAASIDFGQFMMDDDTNAVSPSDPTDDQSDSDDEPSSDPPDDPTDPNAEKPSGQSDKGEEVSSGQTSPGKTNESAVSQPEPSKAISLQDFLKGFNCGLCYNNCKLSEPKCNESESQIAQATAFYKSHFSS